MKQDFKEQLTKVVMSLIQGDAKSAQEAFHQYLPAKSRDILLGEEDAAEKSDEDEEVSTEDKSDEDEEVSTEDKSDEDEEVSKEEEVSKLEEVAKMKVAKKVVGPKSDKMAVVKVSKGKKA